MAAKHQGRHPFPAQAVDFAMVIAYDLTLDRAEDSIGIEMVQNPHIPPRWHNAKVRLRSHIFRAWTALAVLAGFVYGLIYRPEWLTWWKRATEGTVDSAFSLLPYPWGDRIEATVGNFGLWVQITLAIIAFRVVMWVVIVAVRRICSGAALR